MSAKTSSLGSLFQGWDPVGYITSSGKPVVEVASQPLLTYCNLLSAVWILDNVDGVLHLYNAPMTFPEQKGNSWFTGKSAYTISSLKVIKT